ncbi:MULTISPECIES: amidohydrolase family protein [unclassified Sphingopyxis]|uniref:amidohydrolase family protein n=1 Tax=unclassified Sphingopyxis TaxID=2614943 RepID=UPI00286340BB|nr:MULTISPECIES: amidohydrolase family protein [unclassified Sphingopyxis]MDR6834821.1 putative TIM-barrel fold metal-dependent hydrolase [Sphingopyxis sp. BE122]MDR7227092.1 putative TIM-barrel fold metal-dependent hydrolase [Sphingopyxis sp. BE259]
MRHLLFLVGALVLAPQGADAQPAFDSHVHLWNGGTSIAEYESQAKAAGLTISGFGGMWFGGPNQAREGNPDDIAVRNEALIALAKKHPAMMPIATVHPYDGAAARDELQRVAGLGVKMLKIHPHTQRFDPADPRVLALVRRAGELGVIVVMDNANIVPGGDSEKLFNLALAAPKTKFVFAHMGGLNFRFWNILKMARTAEGLFGDNIYFDISAMVTLAADAPIEEEFIWTMRNVGIDHVLIGSDYPQFSLAQTLDALDKLDITPAEKAKIRHENARDLFGLPRQGQKGAGGR